MTAPLPLGFLRLLSTGALVLTFFASAAAARPADSRPNDAYREDDVDARGDDVRDADDDRERLVGRDDRRGRDWFRDRGAYDDGIYHDYGQGFPRYEVHDAVEANAR